MKSSLVFGFFLLSHQINIAFSNHQEKHCWCDSLTEIITHSRNTLQDRYGEQNLDSAPTFTTSGQLNMLARRFHKSLHGKHLFRMGLLGDSMTLPIYDGNSWFYNVSRWVNSVLSSSSCTNLSVRPVDHVRNDFCTREVINNFGDCHDANTSEFNQQPPTFCALYDITSDVNKLHHTPHSSTRPLDMVCDNSVNVPRRCSVHEGSGKFVWSTLGSKGGTTTQYAMWVAQAKLDASDMYDLIFWDHGLNDYDLKRGEFPARKFSRGFFDQLLLHHNHVAAVGVVYWLDSLRNFAENCFKNTSQYYRGNLGAIHYKTLKKLFHPLTGKFQNITLLTMSLPRFCTRAGCYPTDFFNPPTSHPSIMGISAFADLIIWQLLKPFQQIINTFCTLSSSSSTSSHGTHKILPYTSLDEIGMISDRWVYDADINVEEEVDRDHEKLILKASTLSLENDSPVTSWKVLGELHFETPITSYPQSVDKFAFLCAPSIQVNVSSYKGYTKSHNVFGDDNTLVDSLTWVEADLLYMKRAKCAGFNHLGTDRHIVRFDDFHYYSAASTVTCPSGGLSHDIDPCSKPHNWTPNTDYVVPKYRVMPFVKLNDFVFRIHNSVMWEYLCFIKCSIQLVDPIIHSSNESLSETTEWKIEEMKMEELLDGPQELCHARPIDHIPTHTVNSLHPYHYVWIVANKCFRSNAESDSKWGQILESQVLFLQNIKSTSTNT